MAKEKGYLAKEKGDTHIMTFVNYLIQKSVLSSIDIYLSISGFMQSFQKLCFKFKILKDTTVLGALFIGGPGS